METNFQKSFDNGILSKTHFINSEITKEFVRWLIPFIIGGDLKTFNFNNNNFIEAIKDYDWEPFPETLEKFNKWRKDLESHDQTHLKSTCKDILQWGGMQVGKFEKINNLRFFLDHMNKKLSQEEIIIYDLNSSYINSGFTKIYAALNERFIMYDSRVGAALCYLIRCYFESKEENKLPSDLPLELIFGWGKGMGKLKRNPNPNAHNSIPFKEITQNKSIHFISNIKANWLLELIAEKIEIPGIKKEDKVFALQTALFVLGYELPLEITSK